MTITVTNFHGATGTVDAVEVNTAIFLILYTGYNIVIYGPEHFILGLGGFADFGGGGLDVFGFVVDLGGFADVGYQGEYG